MKANHHKEKDITELKTNRKKNVRKSMLGAISPLISGKITKDPLQESCKISPYIMLTHTRSSTSTIFAKRGMDTVLLFGTKSGMI